MKRIFFASLAICILVSPGYAQAPKDYPVRPITLIVAYEAGSSADILVRPLAEKVSAKLGAPIAVVNKPGAGGAIGAREIFDAKPDGYTIGSYNGAVINKLQGLHPFGHRGFDMIGVYNTSPCVIIVNAKKPWKSAKEFIDFAKAHPREVKAATSSKGGYFWLSTVLFEKATGAKLNVVPQTGAGAMVTMQVAGGHMDVGFQDIPTAKSQMAAGNVRLLAIFGPERDSDYPDVPTMKEVGYNVEISVLRPILAPKGIPKPILAKLVQAIGEVAQSPEYMKFSRQQDTLPLWIPEEKGMQTLDEQEKTFRPILQEAGLLKESK